MAIELQTNIALETTPVDPKHLVNIQWVQDFVTGKVKLPVAAVATTDQAGTYDAPTMTLTYTATGAVEIDDVTLALNERVLLVGQTDGTQNGIYTVAEVGNPTTPAELTRAADFNDSTHLVTGVTIGVTQGTQHADTTWKLVTGGTLVLDTTALEFIPVTPSTGAAKYAETITGDGTETDFEIEHNLGDTDVSVSIWNLTTHSMVLADVRTVDNNTVEVIFAEPPAASQGPYRVVVIA